MASNMLHLMLMGNNSNNTFVVVVCCSWQPVKFLQCLGGDIYKYSYLKKI